MSCTAMEPTLDATEDRAREVCAEAWYLLAEYLADEAGNREKLAEAVNLLREAAFPK